MNKSKRLRPVVKIARESEQTAARELAEAQSRVESAGQKLAELELYRDEYQDGLRYKTEAGLNVMQMKDYQAFLGRLDAVIQQQQQVLIGLRNNAAQARETWLQEKQRLSALGKLTDRHQRQEQADSERREQTETNEHALRNWQREFS